MFARVLVLCARLGMGKVGTVALDGTKVAADAAEDELFGDARGDEVPAEAADPRTRDERIAAALADLEAERKAREARERGRAAEYTGAAAAGAPRAGRPPRGAEAEAARIRLEREIAAQQARIDDWQRRAATDGSKMRRPPPR